MATKNNLPPIDDELAISAPRPRLDLKALRPRDEVPDAAVEANSRVMGEQWGASIQLPQAGPSTALTSVRLDLPEYLDRQLSLKGVQDRVTKAYLIMKALAKDGFEIDERDLVRDRRKRGKQK